VGGQKARSPGYYLIMAIAAEMRRLLPRPDPRIDPAEYGRCALSVAQGRRNSALGDQGRDAIRRARESARDIIKAIDTLEHQLRNAPSRLCTWFNPLNRGDMDPDRQAALRLGLAYPRSPLPDDDRDDVLPALWRLRMLCEVFDTHLPARDEVRYWCALDAWQLISAISDKLPANTAGSPFREIAGLLYVGADPARLVKWHAGVDTPDLRRVCTEIHQDPQLRGMFFPKDTAELLLRESRAKAHRARYG